MEAIAVFCAILLVLLQIGTSFYLTFLRGRTGAISYFAAPRGEAKGLEQAQRSQGNNAEYSAILALLILFAGGQPTVEYWWVVCMVAIVVARYLGTIGFYITPLDNMSYLRAASALITYIGGAALAIGVTLPYIRDLMR